MRLCGGVEVGLEDCRCKVDSADLLHQFAEVDGHEGSFAGAPTGEEVDAPE